MRVSAEMMREKDMAKVKIVTDSAALISSEEAEKLDITVVPLTVMVDGKIHQDNVTITREEFMTQMAAADNLPTTSQPSLGVFTDAYESVAGDDIEIVSIHLSKGLSGTANAAEQAARMVNADITVVDSDFIDRAEAFQVLAAAEVAANGGSKEEVLAAIKDAHDKTELYLTIADLHNLVAGGRLSKTAGFVAGLINIQIGAHVVEGNINVEVKGRGAKSTKKYLNGVLEEMKAVEAGIKAAHISHADALEKADAFAEELKAAFPDATITVGQTSPTVSTHTGPGALGFSYITN